MTALNFPDSPTTGQEYTAGDKKWIYNGTAWVSASSLVGTLADLNSESPITYSSLSGTIGLDESELLVDGGTA